MIEQEIFKFMDDALSAERSFGGYYTRDLLVLESPKDPAHGDFAANIAFRLAKPMKRNPNELAKQVSEALVARLAGSGLKGIIDAIEPLNGFVNIRLSAIALRGVLPQISDAREKFGCSDTRKGDKVQVEFVSANPTGTLSVAHARQAAFGDTLANVLSANGFDVVREYYINDEGVQITILGQSIYARYRESLGDEYAFPENGYKGG
ncbi:MAG: arginine--tRNA ligase, partial [Candidatus Omnitrophota bacterium]